MPKLEIIDNHFEFDHPLLKRQKNPVLIILHHSGSKVDTPQKIHKAHKRRGFSGIGYHYVVDKEGNIFIGRPLSAIGAHCKHNNNYSVGICLIGDFRYEQPTEEQMESLRLLVIYVLRQYPSIKRILNHRDLMPTICPAVDLAKMLGILQQEKGSDRDDQAQSFR